MGTWWLPGSETVHYEQQIILPSIKGVITARCCGDGYSTPYNNRNYEPGASSAQQTELLKAEEMWKLLIGGCNQMEEENFFKKREIPA